MHTLSNQLYHHAQTTRVPIRAAIDNYPQITTVSLTKQFQELIIEPIRAAGNILVQMKPIIVIDALDECDDRELMKEFIKGIIDIFHSDHQLPLRILITSRVEEHIQDALEATAAVSAVHRLSLTDFDARPDIRSFFQKHLSALYHQKRRTVMRDVLPPWPSPEDLDTLAKKSDGSFLFATILIDLIGGRGTVPQDNLQKALTADNGLDPLYTQVLADAPRDQNFERVIGTVMLLTKPIAIAFLAHLVQLRSADIVQTLIGLQSVLVIPDDDESIRLFHTSLRDFLTSPERSQHYFIYPEIRHLWIATDCLRVLTEWPTDDIFYGDRERYACLNWCHHLERGVTLGGKDLPGFLEQVPLATFMAKFVSTSMDIWLNTSLLEGYRQLGTLRSVISKLKVGHIVRLFSTCKSDK